MDHDPSLGGAGRDGAIPPHAVSIYGGAGALDDFPVLKAFQQYVDAEQAKAHKRLMSVCFFFTILILVVIGVFMFIISNMKTSDPSADATLKALSENNAALQRQVLDQTVKMNEQLLAQISAKAAAPAAAVPNQIDLEMQRRNFELQSKLNAIEIERRLKAEQEAESAKRAAEAAAKEAAAKAAEPEMSEDEKLTREGLIKKNERAQKKKEEKLKELQERLAREEKRLKEKERELWLRQQYGNTPAAGVPAEDDGDIDGEDGIPAPAAASVRPKTVRPAAGPKPAAMPKPAAAPKPAAVAPKAAESVPASKPKKLNDGAIRYFDDDDDIDAFLDSLDDMKEIELDGGSIPLE